MPDELEHLKKADPWRGFPGTQAETGRHFIYQKKTDADDRSVLLRLTGTDSEYCTCFFRPGMTETEIKNILTFHHCAQWPYFHEPLEEEGDKYGC